MGKVSSDSAGKLKAFIESLPTDARNKCALCSETLTHYVKVAEVQAGVGTATVTNALAEKINEGAAVQDQEKGKRKPSQRKVDFCTRI